MAGLVFPKSGPRLDKSQGERLVWKALHAGLPDGWQAWHSLRLRDGARWEGEGDFVVAVPGRGLLVLEVKGGRVECRDGLWFQNGKKIKAPREQAQRFVRRLVEGVEAAGAKVPGFGVACFFPEVEFSEGPASGDLAGIVLGARDLQWLSYSLPQVVERVLPKAAGRPVDDAWIAVVHRLWGETWSAHVRLRDRARDAGERAILLNEQQLLFLDAADGSVDLKVEGAAGTGKTVLARELARRRSARGERVLYLCFTDALARTVGEWLADEAAPGSPVPESSSVRRRAEQLVGEPWREGADWASLLGQAAARVRDGASRYDLVIVDEAQDLEAADWTLVESLAGGGGLWVFCDPRQRFWTGRDLPPHLAARLRASLVLRKQERNPPDVERLAAAYAGDPFVERPDNMAASVEVVPAGEQGVEHAVGQVLSRLFADGVSVSEVAIVSLAGQTRTQLARASLVAGYRVVRADADDAPRCVVADTFLRFKGLERPFVVVVEPGLALGDRYDRRMHIALTRATAGVVVVAEPEALAADVRLAGLLPAT